MLHVSVRRRQSSGIKTLQTYVHLALKLHNFLPEDGRGQPKHVTCDFRINIVVGLTAMYKLPQLVTAKGDEFHQTNDEYLVCQEDVCSMVLMT